MLGHYHPFLFFIPMIPTILIPAGETERLGSIRHYAVMESLQEEVFQDVVALAARIFSLPISLIALVDQATVWYQANHGLPNVRTQPREEALCSTAILHDHAVVYADLDYELSPLITAAAAAAAHAKALRFYAAAPLRMPDDQPVGAICVIGHQPRPFSTDEQRLLEQIADLVGLLVAARHQCLSTGPAGEAQWLAVRAQARQELPGIMALVRYISMHHGTQVPVAPELSLLISRRLSELREALHQLES